MSKIYGTYNIQLLSVFGAVWSYFSGNMMGRVIIYLVLINNTEKLFKVVTLLQHHYKNSRGHVVTRVAINLYINIYREIQSK